MTTHKVNVKWGKQKFSDVELDANESPEVFKAQLFALSGVDVARQKLMLKGRVIKDSWDGIKLKDGMSFLLMGTQEDAVPDGPAEKMVFVEDLTEDQLVSVSKLPAGLVNLGNTCYMNATLQCLLSAPALRKAIDSFSPDQAGAASNGQLIVNMRQLSKALSDKSNNSALQVAVMLFLQALRTQNPRFAEQAEGGYAQQDAAECWGEVMRSLDMTLQQDGASVVQRYFGIRYKETMRNTEAPDEAVASSTSRQLQLSCHIDKDVTYMMAGLERALKEEITKHSDTLGRDAVYEKSAQIDRLPEFLTVNFVRFYFKRSAGENCKIRKEVKFPLVFDAFQLCSAELKEKLAPARAHFDELRDWEAEQAAAAAGKRNKSETVSDDSDDTWPTSFEDDPGSNNSAYYELKAVLTHKGRSSNSGHYVAWVKQDDGSWLLFDDDKVSVKKPEDILALSGSGGADWHTAYMMLYAAQPCRKVPPKAAKSDSMDQTSDN